MLASTNNPDIRYSKATPKEAIDAIKEWVKPESGAQPLKWLGGFFQRNHLIDFAIKQLPMLKDYKHLTQEKETFVSKAEREMALKYDAMMKAMDSKVMHELGRVQGMATRLDNFDPAEYKGDVKQLDGDAKDVFMAYSALPTDAKKAYATMRDDYKADLLAKKAALKARIEDFPTDAKTKASILREVEMNFDKALKRGVYFPLSRHGDIVIVGRKFDANGRENEAERVVSFAETNAAKNQILKEMAAQGYETSVTQKAAYIDNTHDAANKIAALAIQSLSEVSGLGVYELDEKTRIIDEFNQLLIDALPDASYRKHFIHRKGTLGYSTDALRAYAGTRISAAKNIASLLYNHKIAGELHKADNEIKRLTDQRGATNTQALRSIHDELLAREEALRKTDVANWAQMATSAGFIGALGFNIASASVNLLQVPGFTFPELSGKYGASKAAGAISHAYRLLFNPQVLNKQSGFDLMENPAIKPQEKKALQRLADMGRIDLTMTHDAISMGRNPSYSENALVRGMGHVAKASGYLFHVAEALNRQVTGLAAFNLAMEKNGGNFDEALEAATDALDRTQFDYSQGNRARYMMGNTARVLTLFKSFALGASYYIGRNYANAIKGDTPQERLEARKALATQMAMTFAMSGVFGLPIGSEAFAALGGVAAFRYKGANAAIPGAILGAAAFQALLAGLGADDEDELETEFRNWLTDNFNQTTAEWISKGPARLLPLGDIAGRTGLSDIWIRQQNKELEGRDAYHAIADMFAGPLGGMVAGVFTATKLYHDGEYERMLEAASPAVLRNAIAANRLRTEGAKTIKGDPLINRDLTAVELLNKLAGFNPTVLANASDANAAVTRQRDKQAMQKSHLVNRYIGADQEERMALLRGDIKAFNATVTPAEQITTSSLLKSIKQRKSADKRTEHGLYLGKKQEHLRDIGRFGYED